MSWPLLCAAGSPAAAQAAPGSGLSEMLMMFLVIGAAFYFLILGPQRKEQAARQKMLKAIGKGDRVLTSAGIYGVIVRFSENSEVVTLECGRNILIDFSRAAITAVVSKSGHGGASETSTPAESAKTGPPPGVKVK